MIFSFIFTLVVGTAYAETALHYKSESLSYSIQYSKEELRLTGVTLPLNIKIKDCNRNPIKKVWESVSKNFKLFPLLSKGSKTMLPHIRLGDEVRLLRTYSAQSYESKSFFEKLPGEILTLKVLEYQKCRN